MKKNIWKVFAAICAVLFCAGICVIGYALSPYHPRNVSDEEVIRNGTEYTIKLTGISSYDEGGFLPVTKDFYFDMDDMHVFVGEDGYAYTDFVSKSSVTVDGRYSSAYMDYENYEFCGETYKNQRELEKFFESPDPIYNFDINNIGIHIQDIINYKKQFYGEATVKIYRKRCVITEFYIGEEKAFIHKDIA